MTPLPPNIGRYVVEELVGVGGMGEIYRAQDPVLRRTVAIKLISTKLMSSADRAGYIKRFRREAEAAARCAHPNIVAIYDFALHEEQPYLAMEFVSGRSLRQLLDDVPIMEAPDAIAIVLQVLDALTSAHEQGVIHQDIKPGNIMLTADQRVKVGDFGISRIMTVETMTVFSTVGTPSYMSPEQCRGDLIDARSDLFSAGATLFEMVAGARPFQGRTATEVSHRIQHDSLPLLPPQVRAETPRLQLVLERAMAKNAEDRFDTAADMGAAMRQVLDRPAPDNTLIEPKSSQAVARDLPAPAAEEVTIRPESTIDPDLLTALRDQLKIYVGPIAGILLQSIAKRSGTAIELCSELERSIPEGPDRERFRREVTSLLRIRRPPFKESSSLVRDSDSVRLPEQELERAQVALSDFTGPIAPILVRRAAANVLSIDDLWQTLAKHIDSPTERSVFLRRR